MGNKKLKVNEKIEIIDKVPVWRKATLTLREAVEYTGLDIDKFYELTSDFDCPFVIWVGTKRLIKRKRLEEFLDERHML